MDIGLRGSFAALLLVAASSTGTNAAPSFDCRLAKAPDEKAICADKRLGELEAWAVRDIAQRHSAEWRRKLFKRRQRCENNRLCIANTLINMGADWRKGRPSPEWTEEYRKERVRAGDLKNYIQFDANDCTAVALRPSRSHSGEEPRFEVGEEVEIVGIDGTPDEWTISMYRDRSYPARDFVVIGKCDVSVQPE